MHRMAMRPLASLMKTPPLQLLVHGDDQSFRVVN